MCTPSRFYGWRVVSAAFTVAVFGWGVGFYGPPVFLETVLQSRGWPIPWVSAAVTVHFLVGVLVVASLPRIHRWIGLPAATISGSGLLAVGVLGWALAREPWQLFGAALLSGAGWPALGAAGINAMVSPWFVTRRPAALAIAYNGASMGGVIFSPLWVVLIGHLGFTRAACLVGVVMVGVVSAISSIVLSRTPEGLGQVPDGDGAAAHGHSRPATAIPVGRLRHDPAFITLAAAMSIGLFAQIGLIAHLVSLLAPVLGAQGAGFAVGLATAAAILGRTVVGWLMPASVDRRLVAATSLLVQAAGCSALLASTGGAAAPLALVGVVLIGLGIGNATSLPPLVAQAEFAPADVPRAVALMIATSQAAYAFAPAAFGLIRAGLPEVSVYAVAAALQLLAIGAYVAGRGAHACREARRTG